MIKSMRKGSVVPTVLIALLFSSAVPGGSVSASAPPGRIPPLDSLASNIARLGYVPSGGELPLVAAASGWFGRVSDTRILSGRGSEFQETLSDTSGTWFYCGHADWITPGEKVLVLAPAPWVLPEGVPSSVRQGTDIIFTLFGYWNLETPSASMRTPSMNVVDLYPDSSGSVQISTDEKGLYWIEVMEDGADGPSISLLFPIVSGGTVMEVLSGDIPLISSEATSLSSVFNEMNLLRGASGLPELQRSPLLDSIARSRACELALTGSSAHMGPGLNGLESMLPHAVETFAENIGRGRDFKEAWSMVLVSPFHLRTVLSEEYEYAGLGAALESASGQWQTVIVQVFTGEFAAK